MWFGGGIFYDDLKVDRQLKQFPSREPDKIEKWVYMKRYATMLFYISEK